MAPWPFRRKSRRRRPDDLRGRQSDLMLSSRGQTVPDATEPDTSAAQGSSRRRTTEQNKLQRRARTYSFSPGRHDSILAVRKQGDGGRRDTDPRQLSTTGRRHTGLSSYNKEHGDQEVGGSGATTGADFGRAPTLHNKRDAEHLMPRKKSSKRRKNDHEREAEIKAMSSFVPNRPATEEWTAGRPMRKETRRVRTGLGLGFRGSRHELDEKRSSDISLPFAESMHSGMSSSDSEHVSWKLSALEALAPRPTLRYAVYPRGAPASDSTGPGQARMPSQRRKFSERGPISESTLNANKRVDDIADELDASDLRELMERDKRRRERKRQSDQEKAARQLARRAEKQKAEVADRADSQPVKNLERGVLGREPVGLGIDPASSVVTSSRMRPPSSTPPRTSEKETEAAADDEMEVESRPQPLDTFHRTTSVLHKTPISPEEPREQEPVPTLVPSPKNGGFLRSNKSRSKSPFTLDENNEISETWRKDSDTYSSKGPMSWMSVFRWSNRNRRDSDVPPSFSNTSRETMPTSQLSTPPVNYIAQQKLASGVPRRTMSRFREDLPETTLLSPPPSRVQSPDDDNIPPTIAEVSPDLGQGPGQALTPAQQLADPPEIQNSPHESAEAMRQTPSTFSRPDEAEPSPEPHAMSLASIDSEASWLSGRVGGQRRSSVPKSRHFCQQSHSNTSPKVDQDAAGEEVSIVEDEYLSRLTPSQEMLAWNRKSSGEARPSSDGEGEEARWGSVNGQLPTVVQPVGVDRMKSREGFLNTFGEEPEAEAGSDEGEGDVSPSLIETPFEMARARSVNLGRGHVRSFSAGSAKLLDLTPRSSGDYRRRSVGTRLS